MVRRRLAICMALVLALLCSGVGGLAEDGEQVEMSEGDIIRSKIEVYREIKDRRFSASGDLHGIEYVITLTDNAPRFSSDLDIRKVDLYPVTHNEKQDKSPGQSMVWSLGHSDYGEQKFVIEYDAFGPVSSRYPRYTLVTQSQTGDKYFGAATLLYTTLYATVGTALSSYEEVAISEGLLANTVKIDKNRWISSYENVERHYSYWLLTCETIFHEETAEQSGYYECISSAKWVG